MKINVLAKTPLIIFLFILMLFILPDYSYGFSTDIYFRSVYHYVDGTRCHSVTSYGSIDYRKMSELAISIGDSGKYNGVKVVPYAVRTSSVSAANGHFHRNYRFTLDTTLKSAWATMDKDHKNCIRKIFIYYKVAEETQQPNKKVVNIYFVPRGTTNYQDSSTWLKSVVTKVKDESCMDVERYEMSPYSRLTKDNKTYKLDSVKTVMDGVWMGNDILAMDRDPNTYSTRQFFNIYYSGFEKTKDFICYYTTSSSSSGNEPVPPTPPPPSEEPFINVKETTKNSTVSNLATFNPKGIIASEVEGNEEFDNRLVGTTYFGIPTHKLQYAKIENAPVAVYELGYTTHTGTVTFTRNITVNYTYNGNSQSKTILSNEMTRKYVYYSVNTLDMYVLESAKIVNDTLGNRGYVDFYSEFDKSYNFQKIGGINKEDLSKELIINLGEITSLNEVSNSALNQLAQERSVLTVKNDILQIMVNGTNKDILSSSIASTNNNTTVAKTKSPNESTTELYLNMKEANVRIPFIENERYKSQIELTYAGVSFASVSSKGSISQLSKLMKETTQNGVKKYIFTSKNVNDVVVHTPVYVEATGIKSIRDVETQTIYGDGAQPKLNTKITTTINERTIQAKGTNNGVLEVDTSSIEGWIQYHHNHLSVTKSGNSALMKFVGYGSQPYIDFAIYPNEADAIKTINFNVLSSNVHTCPIVYPGYLVNAGVDEDGKLSGYFIQYTFRDTTPSELILYKITDATASSMNNGSTSGWKKITTGNLKLTGWNTSSQPIEIEVTANSIVLKHGNTVVLEKYDLEETGYHGFGPCVRYGSHGCGRIPSFAYSNLEMYVTYKTEEEKITKEIVEMELDEEYVLSIDTKGQHRNTKGYGDNNYAEYLYNFNPERYYQVTEEEYQLADAWEDDFYSRGSVQVSFPFDVYVKTLEMDYEFVKAKSWVSLPVDYTKETQDITFRIPVWVEERYYTVKEVNKPEDLINNVIVIRGIAENDPYATEGNECGRYKGNFSTTARYNILYNKVSYDYRSYDFVNVNVVGKLQDFEIDYFTDSGYKYFMQYHYTGSDVSQLPVPQKGFNILNSNYQYALKLGSGINFSLSTYGDKSSIVSIKPTVYYIPKEATFSGKTVKNAEIVKVDVYYQVDGKKYEKLGTNTSTRVIYNSLGKLATIDDTMLQDTKNVHKAYYNGTISQTYKPSNNLANYNFFNSRPIGTVGMIKLDEFVRLRDNKVLEYERLKLYGNRTASQIIQDAGSKENFVKSLSRWYGLFSLPQTTVVVEEGEKLFNSRGEMQNIKQDGYLVVFFTIETLDNKGNRYLSYQLPNSKNVETQWDEEGYNTNVTFINGKTIDLSKAMKSDQAAAVCIYELLFKENGDVIGSN